MRNRNLSILAIAFLFTLAGYSSEAYSVGSCQELFKAAAFRPPTLEELESAIPAGELTFERVSSPRVARFDKYTSFEPVQEAIKAQTKRSHGKVMVEWIRYKVKGIRKQAQFYYRYLSDKKIIVADLIEIPPELKGQGLSTYLFGVMFDKHPDVQGIYAWLGYDNRTVFVSAAGGDRKKIRQTPFMKSLKHFGFDKITYFNMHWNYLTITPEIFIERGAD